MNALERRFRLAGGLELAVREHHPQAPVPVLAVHGWLDNAASFDALARHLPQCRIIAVDLPGHGRSGHRPAGTWYHNVDYCHELLELLDQLGWQDSVWLGHSLGGALLALLAAACPERVRGLVLIDSLGLIPGAPEQSGEQLRRAVAGAVRHRQPRPLRVFASHQEAVAARLRANAMAEPAARALVERGLDPVPGGWSWSSDPRLTLASPVRIHEAQIRALLAQLRCPVQLLLADPTPSFMTAADLQGRLACVPQAQLLRIAGSHHFHMESADAVAAAVGPFLAQLPTRAVQAGRVSGSGAPVSGTPPAAAGRR